MENSTKKYCQRCGNVLETGVSYCPQCGEARNFASTPPGKIKAPAGVLILGILQILFSLVFAIVALATPLLAAFLGATFATIVGAVLLLPLVFSILFIAGFNFARILMLIGAVLDIISLAGIIWGIILLWYLTRPRVRAYFTQVKHKAATEALPED